MNKRRDWQI